MQSVVELPLFIRRASEAGMTDEERFALIDLVADNPETGIVIQGTGGVRKLRFARPGAGKSGGYRVVTFYSGDAIPVFLITVFAKSVAANLSKAERNELQGLTKALVETYGRKVRPLRA